MFLTSLGVFYLEWQIDKNVKLLSVHRLHSRTVANVSRNLQEGVVETPLFTRQT